MTSYQGGSYKLTALWSFLSVCSVDISNYQKKALKFKVILLLSIHRGMWNVLHHWYIELFCIIKRENIERKQSTSAGLAAGKLDLVSLSWKQITCLDDLWNINTWAHLCLLRYQLLLNQPLHWPVLCMQSIADLPAISNCEFFLDESSVWPSVKVEVLQAETTHPTGLSNSLPCHNVQRLRRNKKEDIQIRFYKLES